MKKKFIFLGILLCTQGQILSMENNSNQQLKKEIEQNPYCLMHTIIHANLYDNGIIDIEKVKKFVNTGANLDIKDVRGKTALHYAIESQQIEIVTELINAGANINTQDKHGKTALHYAVESQQIEIVTELINTGININIQNEHGETALHYAVEKQQIETVKKLISAGANINLLSNARFPAVYRAIMNNSVEIVKELINANANISIINGFGSQPIDILPNKIHKKCNGNTILHYAAHNQSIIKFIVEESFSLPKNEPDHEFPTLFKLCTLYIIKNRSIVFPDKMNISDLPIPVQKKILENILCNMSLQEQKKLIKTNNKKIAYTILAINLEKHCNFLRYLCKIKNSSNITAYNKAVKDGHTESAALLKTIENAKNFSKLPTDTQDAMINSFKQKLGIES